MNALYYNALVITAVLEFWMRFCTMYDDCEL